MICEIPLMRINGVLLHEEILLVVTSFIELIPSVSYNHQTHSPHPNPQLKHRTPSKNQGGQHRQKTLEHA